MSRDSERPPQPGDPGYFQYLNNLPDPRRQRRVIDRFAPRAQPQNFNFFDDVPQLWVDHGYAGSDEGEDELMDEAIRDSIPVRVPGFQYEGGNTDPGITMGNLISVGESRRVRYRQPQGVTLHAAPGFSAQPLIEPRYIHPFAQYATVQYPVSNPLAPLDPFVNMSDLSYSDSSDEEPRSRPMPYQPAESPRRIYDIRRYDRPPPAPAHPRGPTVGTGLDFDPSQLGSHQGAIPRRPAGASPYFQYNAPAPVYDYENNQDIQTGQPRPTQRPSRSDSIYNLDYRSSYTGSP